jgi:hypothetical protein
MAASGTITAPPAGQQAVPVQFKVDLPAGGSLYLQTADEVDLWDKALARYRDDYVFVKGNDLVTLGSLLQQQIVIFRCQTAINGMEPETDKRNVPTGNYRRIDLDGGDVAAYHKTLTSASKEMRDLEKSLGIDKATREAGGAHTLDSYIKFLKRAAHERGVRITERTLEYERVINELRWKLRLLANGDAEDRAYHDVSPKTILTWLYRECDKLEASDKEWAKQKGKMFVGEL